MGKVKKQVKRNTNHHDNPKHARKPINRRQHSQNTPQKQTSKPGTEGQNGSNGQRQSRRLKVPFERKDRVLLVGEGKPNGSFFLWYSRELCILVRLEYGAMAVDLG